MASTRSPLLPPVLQAKVNLNKATRGRNLFKKVTGRKPNSRKFSRSRTRGRSESGF